MMSDMYEKRQVGSYVGREELICDRKFWKYLVFGILTLGIYQIYYMWHLTKDINEISYPVEPDDESRSPNFIVVCLLGAVTLGIYYLVWWYRQGNRLMRAGQKYGVAVDEKGSTYLLWMILGNLLAGFGSFIAVYLMTKNVNRLARAYNYRYIDRSAAEAVLPQASASMMTPGGGMLSDNGDTTALRGKGVLHGINGEYKGADIEIGLDMELTIGRSGQYSQLVLMDPTISRRHCTIKFSAIDRNFYVTDHSTVGTFWNGSMKIPKETATKCPPGSRLSLGNGTNEFLLE